MIGVSGLAIALGLLPGVVLVASVGVHGFLTSWHAMPQLRSALYTTVLSGVIALAVIVMLGGPTVWYLARVAPARVVSWGIGLTLVPLCISVGNPSSE